MEDVTVDNHYSLPSAAPAPWVLRHVRQIAQAGTVLDLACGSGRNSVWLAAQGYRVLAVDRDVAAMKNLSAVGNVELLCHDLEAGNWPFEGRFFAGIIVTRYLHRPLLSKIACALAPGGVLIYETFMRGNEVYGRPKRDDFLLEPGELATFADVSGLEVIEYREGFEAVPVPAVTQSLCARRPSGG